MRFIKDENYLEFIKKRHIRKDRNLRQQIYKILLDFITKGVLLPNTILLENKIALGFNVSKTPVREAIKRLEIDGLIKILPQSKTYVLPIDKNKVISSHKIREALEILLIEEAVNNTNEDNFKIFDSLIKKQKIALQNSNFDDFYEYDEAFHRQIAKSADLMDAWDILQKVKLHINRVRCMTKDDFVWNSKVIEEHINILKAIKSRDLKLAKLQMMVHLSRVSTVLEKNLIEK